MPRDPGALSPLLTQHINPYGRFELDMEARLPLAVLSYELIFTLEQMADVITNMKLKYDCNTITLSHVLSATLHLVARMLGLPPLGVAARTQKRSGRNKIS